MSFLRIATENSRVPINPYHQEANRSQIRDNVDSHDFEYYENRREGLIEQFEDPGWGFANSQRRKIAREVNNRHVTHAFDSIDWNEGFTGRGGTFPAAMPDVRKGV